MKINSLNVLVLCEATGTIRNTIAKAGHRVTSVDTLPTTGPVGDMGDGFAQHVVADALDFLPEGKYGEGEGWDLVIARPPCTYLTNAGVRWLFEAEQGGTVKVVDGQIQESGVLSTRAAKRWYDLRAAIDFFNAMKRVNTGFLAIENPVPHKYARDGYASPNGAIHGHPVGIGEPTQVVQPWMFGHKESKGTGWWLDGLPPLVETDNVKAEMLLLPKAERNRVHYASPGADRWAKRSLLVQGMADAILDQWVSFAQANIDWTSSQAYIETGRHNTLAETGEFAL